MQRKIFIVWFVFAVGAVALVAGVKVAHRVRARRLQALFTGPCEVDNYIYARMYLTHIDDEGHASPAVRVPLRHVPLASFNIPESLAHAPRIKERQLYEAIRAEAPTITLQTEERK